MNILKLCPSFPPSTDPIITLTKTHKHSLISLFVHFPLLPSPGLALSLSPTHIPTQSIHRSSAVPCWEVRGDSGWITYSQDVAALLEREWNGSRSTTSFTHRDYTYTVALVPVPVQTNTATGAARMVRRVAAGDSAAMAIEIG